MRERIDIIPETLDTGPGPNSDDENQHLARYRFAEEFVEGSTVLDIACGTGYGSYLMARAGAAKVIGMDIPEEAISSCCTSFKHPNLQFSVGSATELRERVDRIQVVVSFETIEHIDKPRLFLQELTEIMSFDGTLLISTPNRSGPSPFERPTNRFHLMEWNDKEFLGILSVFFRQVTIYGQWFHFPASLLPGSRSIRRTFARLIAPRSLTSQLHLYDVRTYPKNVPYLHVRPEFLVAVCRGPVT